MPDVSPIPPPKKVVPDMRKQLVRPKAGKVLVSDTGSMRPLIMGDTEVDLETPPMDQIKEGDDIMYQDTAKGGIAAHRVKRIKKAGNGGIYFICEGIGNHRVPDAINVSSADYIGRWKVAPKAVPSSAYPIQPLATATP